LRCLLAEKYPAWLSASTPMKTEVFDTGALTNREMLLAAYAAYNRRDSDALLALVSEDAN